MKNSSGTIGNRTRDLTACSAVPQPTAPPTFRGNVVSSSSSVESPRFFLDISKLEDKDSTLPRNVGDLLSSDADYAP
jgi:hypothetical protein